jgi:hypothetical protein
VITINSFAPPSGEVDPLAPIVIQLVSSAPFASVSIAARMATAAAPEVIAAGPAGLLDFATVYTGSTAAQSSGGGLFYYTFNLARRYGWQATVAIWFLVTNTAGDVFADDSLVWTLTEPAPIPVVPIVTSSAGGIVAVPPSNYQLDALLAILRASYPDGYIDSIELTPNGGFEVFAAAAQVAARVSLAISRVTDAQYFGTAKGPSKAVGVVSFARATATAGDYAILAGTIVSTSDGRRFRVVSPVAFSMGDLGPLEAQIEAVASGYEYNVPGQRVRSTGEVLEGEIDEIAELVTSPTLIDPDLVVVQVYDTAGGVDAELDAIGSDAGVPRLLGEADDVYRLRIAKTPDTVSPNAIKRAISDILSTQGIAGRLLEHGAGIDGFFFDAGSSNDSPQVPARNFAFDLDFAARPSDAFKLLFSVREFRAFFLVEIEPTGRGEFGFPFDDTSVPNFFDGDSETTPTATFRPVNAFDGYPWITAQINRSLWALIDEKRAAGVGFDFVPAL